MDKMLQKADVLSLLLEMTHDYLDAIASDNIQMKNSIEKQMIRVEENLYFSFKEILK